MRLVLYEYEYKYEQISDIRQVSISALLGKWKFAARAAVTTINASAGGGAWSVLYSYILTKRFKGRLDVGTFTSGILGGLVSITAICDHCRPWQAVLIGFIGGIITSYGMVHNA